MTEPTLLSVKGSRTVDKVREEVKKRLKKPSEVACSTNLLELAVGVNLGNARDTFGYVIEQNLSDRSESWGAFFSSRKKDDIVRYYGLCMSNDSNAVFEILGKKSGEGNLLFYKNGEFIGQCIEKDVRKALGARYPSSWEVYVGEALFGGIKRGFATTRSITLTRGGGSPIKIQLAKKHQLKNLSRSILRLVTLAFIFKPSPVNYNSVLDKEGTVRNLSERELEVLFALTLLFRTYYFPSDFHRD